MPSKIGGSTLLTCVIPGHHVFLCVLSVFWGPTWGRDFDFAFSAIILLVFQI